MHLGCAGFTQHPHECPLSVTANDGVVHDDEPLALDDLTERVELEADAELADGLVRRDEGAPHIGVLDQALPIGDARLLRVADGRGGPGLGRRNDQVGLDGVLASQGAAHLHPGLVHDPAVDGGVRAGEIDVLEDAALGLRLGKPLAAQAELVDGDELTRLDFADEGRADDVEGGRLGGDHPPALYSPQDEGTDALRVASGIQGMFVHEDEAEGAAQHRQDFEGAFLDGRGRVVDQQGGHERGVGGVAAAQLPGVHVEALRAALHHVLAQLRRVDEIAIVRQGDGEAGVAAEGRLSVLPG